MSEAEDREVELVIDNEMYRKWRNLDPVTLDVFRALQEDRDFLADQIAIGVYINDPTENAIRVGVLRGLDRLLNIEYEGKEDYDH